MKNFSILLFWILIFCHGGSLFAQSPVPAPKPGMDFEILRTIPILEGGRKKPLDTFARESVRLITGREKFLGYDPLELLFSWLTQSYDWEKLPLVEADNLGLQKQLQLKVSNHRVAPAELQKNSEFQLFLQAVAAKQEQGLDLSEMEKQGALLGRRLNLFYKISSGSALALLPKSEGGWEDLGQLSGRYPDLRMVISTPNLDAKIAAAVQGTLSAYYQNDANLFAQLGQFLKNLLREQGAQVKNYPNEKELLREVHYNRIKPFRLAWGGYALAFFILLMSFWSRNRWIYGAGLAVLAAVFAVHAYGFFLRIMIAGRAPVTNMYETVIWVPFGVVLFAMILEAVFKARIYAVVAAAVATVALILADSAPEILNPAIAPLVPVLRNNFWLTIHVLTITLSYGAFALGMGVGNVSLGYFFFKPQKEKQIQQINLFLYRVLQVGVVFLAAGTILGGVWANSSWGRFWGWDPKEVWALISLLGYLVILHGRYAGWIRGFGLAAGSVLAFFLVLMAWYGVNFILGAGLHSYGFSSGGAKFVTAFAILEIIWVGLAALRHKWSSKSSPVTA